jgi:hypothetical protein
MGSRYYFHLVATHAVIRDERGALADDLAEAHCAAAEIIKEFKVDQAHRYDEWADWTLIVTDDSAQFALVLPLTC